MNDELCCKKRTFGPGYATPDQAHKNGQKEKILFITCVQPFSSKFPDFLATINVDPDSPSFCQLIDRCLMLNLNDELHHSGWNTCSSCYGDPRKRRNILVLPSLNSDRIYFIQALENGQSKVMKTIEPECLHQFDCSAPHTSHCLPSGQIMISCMGDANGNPKGSLLLIDGQTFEPQRLWNRTPVKFGYDFWYQPRFDILVTSEWSAPNTFRRGFHIEDIANNQYGSSIHFWKWSTGDLLQSIDLNSTGRPASMPLEIRFFHNPDKPVGFVGCAFSSNVFRFFLDQGTWQVEEVIQIPAKKVEGWAFGSDLPPLITDILISMDDQFLFLSAWAFGEIRQYRVSNEKIDSIKPELLSVVRIGGLLKSLSVIEDSEKNSIDQNIDQIQSVKLQGGAQMLQLSLDGLRLYVTNSLFSAWDKQFYPDIIQNGSQLVKINVGKKMIVDKNFLFDFGSFTGSPCLAHEMRYPGGDCTSDIWT